MLDSPIGPALAPTRIRPWESRVVDAGLEMTLDINNVLAVGASDRDPPDGTIHTAYPASSECSLMMARGQLNGRVMRARTREVPETSRMDVTCLEHAPS